MLASAIALSAAGLAAALAAAPFVEERGTVEFEAEAAHHVSEPEQWAKVRGTRGEAFKVLAAGPWKRALRYDVEFTTPGTYRLWVLARKNPTAARYTGNDIKVFLYAAGAEQLLTPKHVAFEIGLKEQKEFRWVDWPKNSPTNTTDLVVRAAGRHHLYLVGGAAEEWGWEVDAIRLTKDNAAPPPGGDAPYLPPTDASAAPK